MWRVDGTEELQARAAGGRVGSGYLTLHGRKDSLMHDVAIE